MTAAPNLQRSPLEGARRRVFHSRVDREKRLIDEPLGPARPREIAVLYVDHHDAANEWGVRYDDDTFARLERASRYEASSAGPDSEPPAVPHVTASSGKQRWSRAGGNTFGAHLTARQLAARGVPPELLDAVLRSDDSDDLTALGLAEDTAEKVVNWYLSKLPSCVVPIAVPAVSEPQPIRATREELASILRLPLHKFLATLTDDQRRLAQRESERLYVVRGAAGSGKTVVGVRRIERWLQQRELFDARPILFTCYNRVLAGAARQMIEDTIGKDLAAANVEVCTAYKLMSRVQRELEGRPFAKLVSGNHLLPAISKAREEMGEVASLARWTDDEILDEIIEVIFARVITSEKDYLSADRSGRGREQRLTPQARNAVWSIYEATRRQWRDQKVAPWDQLPARLVGILERTPVTSPRYAGIVVDEVQDLPPSILRVLLALQAGEDRNMVILGDAAQNVYRNSFRWRHTGLTVAGGQVTTLRRCFRSTPSIIGAASPLIRSQGARFEDDLTIPEPTGEAGPPVRVRLYRSGDDELQDVATEIGVRIEEGVPASSIGVLVDDYGSRRKLAVYLATIDCLTEDYFKPGGEKSIDIFDPSVKLLTTGSAKGIEFQVLFIVGVTGSAYPATDIDGESADRARRVLYTAMMRCAYELQLSCVAGDASRLLDELGGEYLHIETDAGMQQGEVAEPPAVTRPAAIEVVGAVHTEDRRRTMRLFSKPAVTYEYSRLCFKADIIEPLGDKDRFRVKTPDGTFEMSKAEFHRDFANVVESRSYRDKGIYHYPTIPEKAEKYRK